MVSQSSERGFAETLERLLGAIAARGLTVFAQVDHAGAARGVGLKMAPEVVVMFGNPRAGTPLMQSDPRVGVELPLRILVWEAGGVTMVGYNDPRELSSGYEIGDHTAALEAMSSLLAGLAHEAAASD
ncbi:MAG: DUF302 domain-containing protein [Solirubrobacteraceae bacterium]